MHKIQAVISGGRKEMMRVKRWVRARMHNGP